MKSIIYRDKEVSKEDKDCGKDGNTKTKGASEYFGIFYLKVLFLILHTNHNPPPSPAAAPDPVPTSADCGSQVSLCVPPLLCCQGEPLCPAIAPLQLSQPPVLRG